MWTMMQAPVGYPKAAEEYKSEGLYPRPNTSLMVLMP